MLLKQRLLTTVFLTGLLLPAAALAQTDSSTETNLGTLTATGVGTAAANTPGGGQMVNEDSTKQVSTVTRTFIQTQAPTENPFQLLTFQPSVNTASQDAFGGVGGSLNVRGFDSSEMGFTIEGVPVNDSGNYAVYPQEYVDSENLANIFLSQGSVDLTAPHVGASGGNIGISMIDPSDKAGGYVAQSYGTNNEHRSFLRLESGLLPTGTKFYVSASYTDQHKWKGPGDGAKYNIESKLIQTLPHDSSITASFIYVWERNYQYRALTKAQFQQNSHLDYDAGYSFADATNFYRLRVNPFRNIITQATGSFGITENLRLTVQPYFWYGYGNGGGETALNVNASKTSLITNANAGSFGDIFARPSDYPLNTDGSLVSGGKAIAYDPSITTTYRPGIITTLTYSLGNHTLAAGYWLEITRHKQTGTYQFLGANGVPNDIWGHNGVVIDPATGQPVERRNQLTDNNAEEFFLTDDATWFNDALHTYAGIRTPNYQRKTDNEVNYAATTNPALSPVKQHRDYNDILPYFGVSYNINDPQMVYADFAGTFRAPQNYAFFDYPSHVQEQKPETAYTTELGYRYQTDKILFQADIYNTHFINREASIGIDPVDNTSLDRNIGATQDQGAELALGLEPMKHLSLHLSGSYNKSVLQDNLSAALGTNNVILYAPTKGKQFPGVPLWSGTVGFDDAIASNVSFGGNVKYEGVQYATYVNDQSIPAYYYVEIHADYHLPHFGLLQDPTLQLNVINPFSFNYQDIVNSSTINANTIKLANGSIAGSAPNYYSAAPASFTVNLSTPF
jgi:iron complex outermembrane receptor protein